MDANCHLFNNMASSFIYEQGCDCKKMHVAVFAEKPAPGLGHQIEMCWFGFGERGNGRVYYEIPPDGTVNLILRFSSSSCRAFLLGITNKKECIGIDESCHYFGIRFHPGQAPLLADAHHSELVNSSLELPKVFGFDVDSLGERFLSLPTLLLRQRFIEGLVQKTLPMILDERCRRSTALVGACGGKLTVAGLAYEFGLHVRSLERLYLEHVGVTPKQFIRVVRLQSLLAHMRADKFHTFTDLAYTCGYFDQSHMIRDFKELTGSLPGEIGSCKNRRLPGGPGRELVHNLS